MQFYPCERIVVLVDGPNLYAAVRALGFVIDYRKLLTLLQGSGRLMRALYYTTVFDDEEFTSVRPLLDWLDYNGFTLVTKSVKSYVDEDGRRKVKGSMAVELTVDAMQLSDQADHVVIFSGDSEFCALVTALKRRGKRVSVVSTLVTNPPMIADELRRLADQFIDLDHLETLIGRDSGRRQGSARTMAGSQSAAPVAASTAAAETTQAASRPMSATVPVETRSRPRAPRK